MLTLSFCNGSIAEVCCWEAPVKTRILSLYRWPEVTSEWHDCMMMTTFPPYYLFYIPWNDSFPPPPPRERDLGEESVGLHIEEGERRVRAWLILAI